MSKVESNERGPRRPGDSGSPRMVDNVTIDSSVLSGPERQSLRVNKEILGGEVSAVCDYGGEASKYSKNEDSIVLAVHRHPDNKVNQITLAVIDGAGGSDNGQRASEIAAQSISANVKSGGEMLSPSELLTICNDSILKENRSTGTRMYAAGVVARINTFEESGRTFLKAASAGDSKLVVLRGKKGGFEIVREGSTRFDNEAQDAVDAGFIKPEAYYNYSRLNVITTAIGIKGLNPEEVETELFKDDFVVIASDGFWDNFSEYEVTEMAKRVTNAQDLQELLFAGAKDRNGRKDREYTFEIQHDQNTKVKKTAYEGNGDNISIVVLKIGTAVDVKGRENSASSTSREEQGDVDYEVEIGKLSNKELFELEHQFESIAFPDRKSTDVRWGWTEEDVLPRLADDYQRSIYKALGKVIKARGGKAAMLENLHNKREEKGDLSSLSNREILKRISDLEQEALPLSMKSRRSVKIVDPEHVKQVLSDDKKRLYIALLEEADKRGGQSALWDSLKK